MSVPRRLRCAPCEGAGAPPDDRVRCSQCAGSGRASGPLLLKTACWHCGGRGFRVARACAECGGDGLVARVEEVSVRIPPGAATGTKLKLAGRGDESPNGPSGDLLVVLALTDHALFVRHGEDVVCELPLAFDELLLGADVDVPTLEGTVRLTVPPGTQPGTLLRLTGRGLPRANGPQGPKGRGDALYRALLEHPVHLRPQAREALEALRRATTPEDLPRRTAFSRAVAARR
jgi:molecular chaperone DnaJ